MNPCRERLNSSTDTRRDTILYVKLLHHPITPNAPVGLMLHDTTLCFVLFCQCARHRVSRTGCLPRFDTAESGSETKETTSVNVLESGAGARVHAKQTLYCVTST